MPDTFEELALDAFDAAEAIRDSHEEAEEPTEDPELDPEDAVEDPEDDGEPEELEDEQPEDEDDEPEDEDEEGEADTADGDPLSVTDDTVLTLPDGTTTTVKDALLRQADYTRKTQELAEQRREVEDLYGRMETWFNERASNPVGWTEEIILSTQDPTATVAQAIVNLAKAEKLDPEFVKTFGLDSGKIADEAHTSQVDQRVSDLEKRLEEEKRQAAEQQEYQKALADYRRQYAEVVGNEGLEFESVEAENAFKQELATFAKDHQITDLRVAYDALARQQEKARQAAESQEAQKKAKAEVDKRKKRTSAISKKASSAPNRREPSNFEEAAAEAVEQLLSRA